jgi:hypothetical protein
MRVQDESVQVASVNAICNVAASSSGLIMLSKPVAAAPSTTAPVDGRYV